MLVEEGRVADYQDRPRGLRFVLKRATTGVYCRTWEPKKNSNYSFFRAASLTLRTVLLSIQALMCSPEPKDPQDAVVAKQYMSNPGLFKETAVYWTIKYAKGKAEENPHYRERVEKLRDMGVTE
ncbi:ubiquitin--protein ligase, partial [Teladorsagia circumcincta]